MPERLRLASAARGWLRSTRRACGERCGRPRASIFLQRLSGAGAASTFEAAHGGRGDGGRRAAAPARGCCAGSGSVSRAMEKRFARFKGTERSLYFSSGYLANLAVLTTFPEAGDVIFSDERNHASLIDGARLSRARRVVFPHNDVEALERLLREDAGRGSEVCRRRIAIQHGWRSSASRGIRCAVPGRRRGVDRRRSARYRGLWRARQGTGCRRSFLVDQHGGESSGR